MTCCWSRRIVLDVDGDDGQVRAFSLLSIAYSRSCRGKVIFSHFLIVVVL